MAGRNVVVRADELLEGDLISDPSTGAQLHVMNVDIRDAWEGVQVQVVDYRRLPAESRFVVWRDCDSEPEEEF
jgi:hypothetical protein